MGFEVNGVRIKNKRRLYDFFSLTRYDSNCNGKLGSEQRTTNFPLAASIGICAVSRSLDAEL